jgi:spore coat protein H
MSLRTLFAVPLLAGACLAQGGLFQTNKVWTVHLTFAQDQWRALEPKNRPGQHGIDFGRGEWLQGPPGKRNGLASAMGIEFMTVHADLTFDGRVFKDIGVRYKGNGTYLEGMGAGKLSFKLDLNQFVKGQKLDGVTKLNLHNNVTDASWMNEPLSYRLYRDAGVPAPRTAYARVYIKIAGQTERYAGLYSLVENVDAHFADAHFTNKGGAFLKPVSTNLFRYLGEDWAKYDQTYDPKAALTDEQKKRIIAFTRLVSQADEAQFAAQFGDYVEVDEFARFMAVMVFLSDMDGLLGPGQNFYMYLDPKTQKFSFVPWDQDHSFGQFPMNSSQRQRENLSIHKPWIGSKRFFERVFQMDRFKKLYLAKVEEFSQTIFEPERFGPQVDEIAAAIRPAVQEESDQKLQRFDRAVAGTSQSFVPIKPFVKKRAKSILDQLAGRSQGERIGEGPR